MTFVGNAANKHCFTDSYLQHSRGVLVRDGAEVNRPIHIRPHIAKL